MHRLCQSLLEDLRPQFLPAESQTDCGVTVKDVPMGIILAEEVFHLLHS